MKASDISTSISNFFKIFINNFLFNFSNLSLMKVSIVILNLFFNSSYYLYPQEMTSNIFLLILLISTVSQLGDIIISYFKRSHKCYQQTINDLSL